MWGPGSQNEAKKPPKRFKNSTSQPSWGPENTPRAPQKGPQRPPRGHQIGQKTTKRPQYQHRCGPEALLGPLGAVLGPSWGCLGAILGPPGGLWGPSWGHFGASKVLPGPIFGPLGAILAHVAAKLKTFIFLCFLTILGPPGAPQAAGSTPKEGQEATKRPPRGPRSRQGATEVPLKGGKVPPAAPQKAHKGSGNHRDSSGIIPTRRGSEHQNYLYGKRSD